MTAVSIRLRNRLDGSSAMGAALRVQIALTSLAANSLHTKLKRRGMQPRNEASFIGIVHIPMTVFLCLHRRYRTCAQVGHPGGVALHVRPAVTALALHLHVLALSASRRVLLGDARDEGRRQHCALVRYVRAWQDGAGVQRHLHVRPQCTRTARCHHLTHVHLLHGADAPEDGVKSVAYCILTCCCIIRKWIHTAVRI